MTSPYQPPQYYYQTPYLHPYYHQAHISPFVPAVSLPASPNGSPHSTPRRVRWEDEEEDEEDFVVPPPPPRLRRPSWHTGLAPPPNPLPFPSPPFMYSALPPVAGLPPGIAPPAHYIHQRRASDSALPHPTWFAFPTYPTYNAPAMYPGPPPAQLHPMLNGEAHEGPLLLFDLSLHEFDPRRISKPGKKTGKHLTVEELGEQATHPGVTHMRITCDEIPQWPIVLEATPRSPYLNVPQVLPQITVGDVLIAIHKALQTRITHVDWAKVRAGEDVPIAQAYTRRCRTYPSAQVFEASQGVRRVDYLLDKYYFKGLVRAGSTREGFEKVKLLVGKKP